MSSEYDRDLLDEQAEIIAALEAEVGRLRAALQPFVDYAPWLPSTMPDDFRITFGGTTRQLTIGDCRRAARALDESAKEKNAYPTVIPRSNNNETGSP
jgi:hypothetical protein